MIDFFYKAEKLIGGSYTINTIIHYHYIYLKYRYYRNKGEGKMQSYTNCSIECFTCERTVIEAVKIWKKLLC